MGVGTDVGGKLVIPVRYSVWALLVGVGVVASVRGAGRSCVWFVCLLLLLC